MYFLYSEKQGAGADQLRGPYLTKTDIFFSLVVSLLLKCLTIQNKHNKPSTLSPFNFKGNELSRVMRKPTFWFPTWSDTNQAVQLQKMATGLKFRIKEVEGLYYLCSKNKGADQLRVYREADLRLCFRICKIRVATHYPYQNSMTFH